MDRAHDDVRHVPDGHLVPDGRTPRPRLARGPPMNAHEQTPPKAAEPAPDDPILADLIWLQDTREVRLAEDQQLR
ncbi:hypothetical protein ABZX72_29730 [Streptomyces cyaneofuscatus]|uniref:hypothetical protein n=1 Tax=Streptomyces cyaneofuscatus TaxID=66883 RepID=UPI0033AA0FFD